MSHPKRWLFQASTVNRVSVTYAIECASTYQRSDVEVEEEDACQKADNDGDTGRKVLGNVVRIVHDQGHDHATRSLEDDRKPYNPVVACEETSLGKVLAVLEQHSNEQRRPQGIERELDIAHPDRDGMRVAFGVLQDLLEVHSSHAR